jgi:hypothetical protein
MGKSALTQLQLLDSKIPTIETEGVAAYETIAVARKSLGRLGGGGQCLTCAKPGNSTSYLWFRTFAALFHAFFKRCSAIFYADRDW